MTLRGSLQFFGREYAVNQLFRGGAWSGAKQQRESKGCGPCCRVMHLLCGTAFQFSSIFSAEIKASWGISTLPNWRIFFLPSFCLSRSLRLRLMSPP